VAISVAIIEQQKVSIKGTLGSDICADQLSKQTFKDIEGETNAYVSNQLCTTLADAKDT